jgi:putative membrane protein
VVLARSSAAAVLAALIGGCSGGEAASGASDPSGLSDLPSEAGTDAGPGAQAAGGEAAIACQTPVLTVSQGDIAGLLDAIDAAEVSLDEAVRARLNDAAAVAFAEKAITDHTLLDLQLRGAVRADRLAITSTDTSAAISSQEAQAAQAYGPLQGASLDRAYLAHEILVHLQELAILDRMAIPGATDVRLVASVASARELAAEHLQLASSAQAKLDAPP